MSHPGSPYTSFDGVIEHLRRHLGLLISPEQRVGIEKKICRIMLAQGGHGPEWLLSALRTDEAILNALVDELTVGETYFFRNPDLFALIRRMIVPELLRTRRPDTTLHVWSAGCASGEEAYSLAILLEEEGLAARTEILGTDISQAALQKARTAVYSDWSFRGDGSAQLAERYFSKEEGQFRLATRFRSRVRFRTLNLASDFTPSPENGLNRMDLILCRNVLIYLDKTTTQAVARRLFDCLADGGWLLTGPSDPPLWPYAPFRTTITASGVLYRRHDRPACQRRMATQVGPERLHQRRFGTAGTLTRQSDEVRRSRFRSNAAFSPIAAPGMGQVHEREDPCGELAAIRGLADQGDIAAAESATSEAIRRQPLAVEPRYMSAILALAAGRSDDAAASLHQLIYIDPGLAAAHMMLGTVLQARGDFPAARRAYETAFSLCADKPEHESVPLADGETAGALARAAKRQFEQLLFATGGTP